MSNNTESITIGDVDYTATDAEARAIMDRLADHGVTELTIAHTPYRELVNMILAARLALRPKGPTPQGS
jgi:hypothetical protein